MLQKHYANLQALALDQDAPEEVVDETEPDAEEIDKRLGAALIERFREVMSLPAPSDLAAPVKTPATKRKRKTETGEADASTSVTETSAKRGKKAAAIVDVAELDMTALLRDEAQVNQFTISHTFT